MFFDVPLLNFNKNNIIIASCELKYWQIGLSLELRQNYPILPMLYWTRLNNFYSYGPFSECITPLDRGTTVCVCVCNVSARIISIIYGLACVYNKQNSGIN
jgi:hypothetical protein